MDSLLPEVQEIFRAVFDQPDLIITRESNASTVEDWDSLAHVNLITAIARNPSAKDDVMKVGLIGFALTESIALIAFVTALIILSK